MFCWSKTSVKKKSPALSSSLSCNDVDSLSSNVSKKKSKKRTKNGQGDLNESLLPCSVNNTPKQTRANKLIDKTKQTNHNKSCHTKNNQSAELLLFGYNNDSNDTLTSAQTSVTSVLDNEELMHFKSLWGKDILEWEGKSPVVKGSSVHNVSSAVNADAPKWPILDTKNVPLSSEGKQTSISVTRLPSFPKVSPDLFNNGTNGEGCINSVSELDNKTGWVETVKKCSTSTTELFISTAGDVGKGEKVSTESATEEGIQSDENEVNIIASMLKNVKNSFGSNGRKKSGLCCDIVDINGFSDGNNNTNHGDCDNDVSAAAAVELFMKLQSGKLGCKDSTY